MISTARGARPGGVNGNGNSDGDGDGGCDGIVSDRMPLVSAFSS
jgi:hypothetical protein